jgi:capsid portal protein
VVVSRQVAKNQFMTSARFLVDGVVEPTYPLPYLRELVRTSSHLRPNIDAMVNNIAGHGHGFVKIFDPDADDAADRVAAILDYERWRRTTVGGGDEAVGNVPEVTEQDVRDALMRLKIRQQRERVLLDHWFATATPPPDTFMGLRKKTIQEQEWYGFAFWEAVREQRRPGQVDLGRVAWFQRVPADETRIVRGAGGSVKASHVVRRTVLTSEVVTAERTFCRYVQQCGGDRVYFKQFGDPRDMSRETGKYTSETEGKLPEGQHLASEIIHFMIPDPSSRYGSPRWMNSFASVLGSRRADEVNAEFFANSAIPPLAVLVQSGRLTRQSAARVASLFKEKKDKGLRGFWDVLVLECQSNDEYGTEASGKANITIESLMRDLASAADRYVEYDKANSDKIAGTFRLGRVMRGIGDGVNRATAMALLMIAESQVFAPERNDFDIFMTDFILPAIGVTTWRFASTGPKMADPVEIATVARDAYLAKAMSLTEYRNVLLAVGMPISFGMEDDEADGEPSTPSPTTTSPEEQDDDAVEGEATPAPSPSRARRLRTRSARNRKRTEE